MRKIIGEFIEALAIAFQEGAALPRGMCLITGPFGEAYLHRITEPERDAPR